MSEIGNTLQLWVVNRHNTFLVLAQGPTGTPEPIVPSPILHKAVYLSNYDASSGDLRRSSAELDSPQVTLLAKFPSPDGPPAQTALLFPYQCEEIVSYQANGRSFPRIAARRYRAAGPGQGYIWQTDILQGRPGYFLIGSAEATNLWRIARVEVDYAQRYDFTLIPVRFAHGLPTPDFTKITDQAIRKETEQHWSELQDALVRNRPYGVVTAAKNTAESLLYYFLLTAGHISAGNRSLADLLKKLESVLADANTKATVPLDPLSLHLIQKMRILHGRTHVGRVVTDGRAITPELALTVATDLVEVLRCASLVVQQPLRFFSNGAWV